MRELPLFLQHQLNGSYNSQLLQAPTCTEDMQSSLAPPYLPSFRHQPNSLLNRSFGPIFFKQSILSYICLLFSSLHYTPLFYLLFHRSLSLSPLRVLSLTKQPTFFWPLHSSFIHVETMFQHSQILRTSIKNSL